MDPRCAECLIAADECPAVPWGDQGEGPSANSTRFTTRIFRAEDSETKEMRSKCSVIVVDWLTLKRKCVPKCGELARP